MSAAPLDAAERAAALDPDGSFIVQAPAGSGKTELLTRRVLTLLARVEEPEQVLAITFTRKAAAEMRHRVVAALARARSGDPPANDYDADGLALARAALARDAARGWRLLDDPGRLAMRTIDSLATSLAHRLPVVSALGAAIATVDDPGPLHREAAERFLDHHLETIDRVCLQRDNRLEQVRDLLAELLAVRDQWQGYVQDDLDDERLRALLQSMLDDVVRTRLAAARRSAPDSLASDLETPLRRAAALLVARADAFGEPLTDVQARIVALADRAGTLPPAEPEGAEDWRALAEFLLTGGGTPRKRLDKSSGFPAQGEAAKLGTDKGELAAHKDALLAVLATLGEEDAFVTRLHEARGLGGLVYGDEDWALLGQLAGGLRVLLGELQLVFRERREIDFIEISSRARQALGDDEHPTDLALAMDVRLQHLLVDEFQDTSHAQFALFERLVSGWDAGDGRTFFAVGDPMQAIYRFREGDVGLFLRAIEEGIGPVALTYLRLSVNFRSVPGIIGWINAGFGAAFPTRSDRDIGAVTYEPSAAHLGGEGDVTLHALAASGTSAEAAHREGERVAELVSAALAEDPAQSIGVLVRARSHASAVVSALHARAIPFRAIEIERLGERPVVLDLVALAHALCYPHDRVSWLALLRGPLCGLVLDDLHALVSASEQRPLIELLHDPARRASLSADGGARVARFLEVMGPAVEQAPRGTVVPWLEAVWLQLGGPAACAKPSDLEAAERCIARLAALEREGSLRRRRTVEAAMERLFAGEGAEPDVRVQLMTLHKSKGLEFDTVILPALGRGAQADRARLMEWFRTDGEAGPRLLLAPIDRVGAPSARRNPVGQLLKGFRDRANEAERLRLFYVACTRARRRLHLVATLRADEEGRAVAPAAGGLLAPLWPMLREGCELIGGEEEEGTVEEEGALDAESGDVARRDPAPGAERGEEVRGTSPSVREETLPADHFRAPPPFVRAVSDWTLPLMSRFAWASRPAEKPATASVDYDWRGTTAREVGTVVHRALQRLAALPAAERHVPGNEGLSRIARELRTLGVTDGALDEAVGQVVEAIRNTLDDERGRWLLDEGHAEARSEWALSVPELVEGRYAGVRRVIVDRSFVDAEGCRWIVDYKTGSHEGGDLDGFLDRELERYAGQLDGYAEVLARVEPERPLRLGLWFPMVRGWRERVAGRGEVEKG